jgi:hypothetical protein
MWALVHYVRSLSERDEHVHGREVETAQAPHAPGGSPHDDDAPQRGTNGSHGAGQ